MIASFSIHSPDLINSAYIVSFSLFILGLRWLKVPTTARRGNFVSAVGMLIAVVATLLTNGIGEWWLIVLGIAVGTIVGVPAARSVKMTAMPQMVALFNGVGGGAVALIAWAEYRKSRGDFPAEVEIPTLFGAVVGSISFWGSNVAFLKLQELISGGSIKLPAQQFINALLALGAIVGCVLMATGTDSQALFIGVLVASALLGLMLVLPIGGADMPVVISMLNAATGLSAAAAGIALDNTALIVAGTIVGASGSILTKQMAEAMNRSIGNILFSGFGTDSSSSDGPVAGIPEGATVTSTSAQDVAIQLAYAENVVFVPGYGMAVAQAQHTVRELASELERRGIDVKYAIHPVAGRMPGHMNVLLAEADVPYDQLKEMDEINPEFSRTDVAMVIGANDVTNPAARDNTSSPIYGMPILDVDAAASIVVLKRSMNPGFAGIDNELYYNPKTSMLFGDAKKSVAEVTSELTEL